MGCQSIADTLNHSWGQNLIPPPTLDVWGYRYT